MLPLHQIMISVTIVTILYYYYCIALSCTPSGWINYRRDILGPDWSVSGERTCDSDSKAVNSRERLLNTFADIPGFKQCTWLLWLVHTTHYTGICCFGEMVAQGQSEIRAKLALIALMRALWGLRKGSHEGYFDRFLKLSPQWGLISTEGFWGLLTLTVKAI